MEIELPFGDAEVTLKGRYYHGKKGCMYLRNGDPGYPDEQSEFNIETAYIGEEDVGDTLFDLYVKKPDGKFELWIESVYDRILEQAEEIYEGRRQEAECSR